MDVISDIGLPTEIQETIRSLGFEELTPIQTLCLLPLRVGKDVIAQSRTGSGKTFAFALPLVEKVQTERRFLQGLILCPTRELCEQVAATVRKSSRFKKDFLVTTLVGGQPLYLQLRALRHGVHVVVGTPGRVLDLLRRRKLDLGCVHTVILDEADRMLDMGFRESIEKILENTPSTRQTALFSATFPPTIEALSRHYQKDAERITVDPVECERVAIEESFYRVDGSTRVPTLIQILKENRFGSVLVFCNFKVTVDELTQVLRASGLPAGKIHGNLEQIDRNRVMARFRMGSVRILVATDVAARGLDISGIDAVINFELPNGPETYVHRIGRTGRAGQKGAAFSLWKETERPKLKRLEEYLKVPLPQKILSRSTPASEVWFVELGTIEISGGRKEKLRPGDILGALTGKDCTLPGSAIGKIEIKDHVSYVAVRKEFMKQAIRGLRQGKIKNRRFFATVL